MYTGAGTLAQRIQWTALSGVSPDPTVKGVPSISNLSRTLSRVRQLQRSEDPKELTFEVGEKIIM